MRGTLGVGSWMALGFMLQGCASVPHAAPEVVASCDRLFRTAPAALPVFDQDVPRLRNAADVGTAVESRYHTRLNRVAVVQALVQPDGRISHACLLAGSGDAEYDRAALDASRDSRWEPAVRDGGPVDAWVSFPVATRMAVSKDPSGRYVPLALGDRLLPGRLSADDVEIQALVLEHLLGERTEPPLQVDNRALCVGVGPGLPLLDPPARLTRRLAEAPLPVVPATACRIDLEHRFPGARGARLLLERTGEQAAALWADLPEHTVDGAVRVRAGYYADGPAAAGYECTLRRGTDAWSVVECELLAF